MEHIATSTAQNIFTTPQQKAIPTQDNKQAINSVTLCKKTLNTICEFIREQDVSSNGLGEQALLEISAWKEIHANLSDEFLEDASSATHKFSDICMNVGITLNEIRPTKSMQRITTKFEGIRKYAESSGKSPNYFKVVSDFAGATVYCSVNEIENTVAKFQDLAKTSGGWCAVRGLGQDPYGYHKKDDEYKDILQYLFVYLPEVGHVVEIQVGHPFGRETFKRDSFLRENKSKLSEDQLPVDLWGDFNVATQKSENNLYGEVKQYLLLQANQPSHPDLPQIKDHCIGIANNLFGSHRERQPMSKELRAMLEKL
ncbi:MAG: hypothetical protein K0R08_1916 [Solimicrobium sp.]|jgi:hypothetical protein|nr:hypothetical protein [Solimicrobium sp.]